MKKLLLSLFAISSMIVANAQYYYIPGSGSNPGGLNTDVEYPVGGGISAGWSTLLGGAFSTPSVANGTVPFSFNFSGTNFTSFKITTSGVLTFSTAAFTTPAYASVDLSSTTIPDSSICILGITPIGSNQAYANIVTKTFGASPNRQFWITYSAYNELSLGNSAYFFASIVLEETTNKIYIVDQRRAPTTATNLSLGIKVNSANVYMVAGSPHVNSLATSDASPADNVFYAFSPGTQPANDIYNTSVNMLQNLILSQAPFTVSTNIKNLGTATLTSATLNYSVNGGATVSAPVSGLSVVKFATSTISSTSKWTPSAIGAYTIKVWTSMPNGVADAMPANDTATIMVNVWNNFVQRNVLHELFTSSTCPPCAPANTNIDNVLSQRVGKWNIIKYQVNFPGTGDPYNTAESMSRFSYYGSTFAPWLVVDGSNSWGAADANGNSYTTNFLDNRAVIPSFMTIAATQTIVGNTFTVTGTVTPLGAISNPNLKLKIAIVERKTVNNVKTNGETVFYNVMKKMLPNATGSALSLTAGTAVSFNQSFTFPGSYRLPVDGQSANIINLATENSVENFGNLVAVIFVQDESTKEILQSGSSGGVFALGVNNISKDNIGLNVYPNPSTGGTTTVEFTLASSDNATIEVYDIVGQKKMTVNASALSAGDHSININTNELGSGIYFMKLTTSEGSSSFKFMVSK